jgi:hypothetical protein
MAFEVIPGVPGSGPASAQLAADAIAQATVQREQAEQQIAQEQSNANQAALALQVSRRLGTTKAAAPVVVTMPTGVVSPVGTGTFTVALPAEPTADVTVTLTITESPSPFAPVLSETSLTFTSANGTTPQTVTVTPNVAGAGVWHVLFTPSADAVPVIGSFTVA